MNNEKNQQQQQQPKCREVEAKVFTAKSPEEMDDLLVKIGNEYTLLDVKFSTTCLPDLKHTNSHTIAYSILVFGVKKNPNENKQ